MSLSIIAFVVANSFAFPGGTDFELAAAISKAVAKPVSILCSGAEIRHSKVQFQWTGAEDFRAKAKNLLKLSSIVEGEFAFSRGKWPVGMFFANRRFEYVDPMLRLTNKIDFDRKDGRIRLITSSGAIQLSQLEKFSFTKPLKIHWFLRNAFLAVYADSAKEESLLRTLAESAGAKFVVSKSAYEFQFSPQTHRRWAIALLQEEAKIEKVAAWRSDRQYGAAVYSNLSDSQLRQVYAKENGSVLAPLIGSAHVAATQRLLVRYGNDGSVSQTSSMRDTYRWIQENVDFEHPGWAVVRATGGVTTRLQLKDPKGAYEF